MEELIARELNNINMFHGDNLSETTKRQDESIFKSSTLNGKVIDLQLTKNEMEEKNEHKESTKPIQEESIDNPKSTMSNEEYQELLKALQEKRNQENDIIEESKPIIKKKKPYFGSLLKDTDDSNEEFILPARREKRNPISRIDNEDIEESYSWNWKDIGIGAITGLLLGSALLSRPKPEMNYIF